MASGFGSETQYASGGDAVAAVAVADLTGDGFPDLVVGNVDDPTTNPPPALGLGDTGARGDVAVLVGGAGGFSAPRTVDLATATDHNSVTGIAVAAGQLNGDGLADIVVLDAVDPSPTASPSTNDVRVLLNAGGSFGASTDYALPAGFTPQSVTLADVNGDGAADVVVGGYDADSDAETAVLLNDGAGHLGTPTLYAGLAATAAADLNADGKVDLVGAGSGTVANGAQTDSAVVVATNGPNTIAVCYVAGTRILTARGELAVERLQVGDRALALLSQALLPIRWLGHRTLDLRAHPFPALVRPVRIRAGALAEGVPMRDLCVSPRHCLHLDGVLVQARHLVNGVSVVQEDPEQVTYWHVELERHDVLLAEGAGAESYLDTGNRADLEEHADVQALHPDFLARHAAETCAPVVEQGPLLEAVKGRVLARAAAAFGARTTEDPELMLLADGVPVSPREVAGRYYRFVPPEGTCSLVLASRTWVPAQLLSGSTDARTLGVCVRALALDGVAIALDDPRLVAGWDKPERDAGGPQRWTCGMAELPANLAQVELRLDGYAEYRLLAGREAEAATG